LCWAAHSFTVFIAAIIVSSFVSRAVRSIELRITKVTLDHSAEELLTDDDDQFIHLVARSPETAETVPALEHCDDILRKFHNLNPDECVFFFEVYRSDASDFSDTIVVQGRRVGRHRILYTTSPAVANSIAATLLHLKERTGHVPHAYFRWAEVSPVANIFRFIFLGEGDTAPLTQEILRRTVPNIEERPVVHVS